MKFRFALITLLAVFAYKAQATHPGAVYKNNEAVDLMVKENHSESYRKLLKALELAPLDPTIQYNLAVAFLGTEEYEKALKQFALANEMAPDDELRFKARFGAGVAATHLKQIDEALKYYQAALEIDPDNEDVKKNIELLWKGGQGGEGDSQNQDQNQEGKEGSNKDQEQKDQDGKDQNRQGPQPRPRPQEFKSKELTPDQVRKILEELKAQEQKIRAEENEKDRKDAPNAKDW